GGGVVRRQRYQHGRPQPHRGGRGLRPARRPVPADPSGPGAGRQLRAGGGGRLVPGRPRRPPLGQPGRGPEAVAGNALPGVAAWEGADAFYESELEEEEEAQGAASRLFSGVVAALPWAASAAIGLGIGLGLYVVTRPARAERPTAPRRSSASPFLGTWTFRRG